MQLIALSGPAHALVAGLIAERWVAPSVRYSTELARARPLAVQSSIDAMLRAAADQRADCLVVNPVRTHAEADWIAARGGSLIVIERAGWPANALSDRAAAVLRDDDTVDELRRRVVDVVSGILTRAAA